MPIIEPIFQALNDAKIRYVVVGGLATVLHGHARLTVDIDLMVDLASDHARRIVDVLTNLGLQPHIPMEAGDFADATVRNHWKQEKNMQVFSMSDPKNPMRIVDLFIHHPIPFEELWTRAALVPLASTTVRVASLPDLIHLKRLAGRPQDLADIEKLEHIRQLREGKDDG